MDVDAAELGAAMELREDLAGIEQPVGVEGAFEAQLLVEIDLVEHDRHEIALLDADAVLAGEDAADLDAEAQDIGAERLGALELARLVGIVKDQRMEVAVAGMNDVGDAQPIVVRQHPHPRQHLRQATARDGAVHAVVIRRDPPDRGEGSLAAGPEGKAFLLALADPDRDRRVRLGDRSYAFDQMVALDLRPVELYDKQGLDIERIAGPDEGLGGVDR